MPPTWLQRQQLCYNANMIRPSRARFLMAEQPEPLILSVPLPTPDVFELYRRIANPGRSSFLLESGQGSAATARYSFMASDPYALLSGGGRSYQLRSHDGTVSREGHPYKALAEILRASRMPRPDGAPPFFGGAVGLLTYDAVRQFDRLPSLALDDLHLPELVFGFFELVAAVDHRTDTLHLIFAPPLDRLRNEPRQKLYREGCDRLAELEARLSSPQLTRRDSYPFDDLHITHITPGQTRMNYMDRVRQCKEYIAAGDIYQANLSHRFEVDFGGPSSRNPSPYPSPQRGEGIGCRWWGNPPQSPLSKGEQEDGRQAGKIPLSPPFSKGEMGG